MSILKNHDLVVLAGASLAAAIGFACSGQETEYSRSELDTPASGGEGASGNGGSAASAAGGNSSGGDANGGSGSTVIVNPPTQQCGACPEGTFCSVRYECIAAGTCLDDADCGEGRVCDEAGLCTTGGDCGASEFDITRVPPPNLLLVLDRSCSMTMGVDRMGEDVSAEKWVPVVDVLVQLTTTMTTDIRFGLELFPDGLNDASECLQNPTGEIAVPIGPDGGALAAALLTAARTDDTHPIYPGEPCQTNTYSALAQAAQQPELQDPERDSYIVLITDGEPYCSDRDQPNETDDGAINQVISDLAASGVPTFVVGFGNVADVDPEALAGYAASGGTTPSADEPYYDAANQEQLQIAMETIAGTIVPCDYTLDEAPPDDDDLYVFFDDETQVPRDPTHVEGWDFDPATNTLSFFGNACSLLQNEQVLDVDVVYGCPMPQPE